MTRINAAIPPYELCDQHLNAEKFEITRIPTTIINGRAKTSLENIPETFCLGTGHVKFFYNKILYLKNRYLALCQESEMRGFNCNVDTTPFDLVEQKYPHLFNNWFETPEAKQILLTRLSQKLTGMKRIKHTPYKIPSAFVL